MKPNIVTLKILPEELKALETISEIDYKKLKPRCSSFGVLYGLCKTHKKVLDKCPPIRPILSVKLPLTIYQNNFTVKHSFEFSKEICE